MFNSDDPWAEVSTLTDMLRSLRVLRAEAAYLGNDDITISLDIAIDEVKGALEEAEARAACAAV